MRRNIPDQRRPSERRKRHANIGTLWLVIWAPFKGANKPLQIFFYVKDPFGVL